MFFPRTARLLVRYLPVFAILLIIGFFPLSSLGSVRVAVLDTGIVESIPLFKGRLFTKHMGACSDQKNIKDDEGHGTAVAGIIAELSRFAEILPIRFNGQYENASEAKIICALELAMNSGAKVINVSYGKHSSSPALEQAFRRVNAAGILVIAAAGNELANRDTHPIYPASYALSNMISVAAVDDRGAFLTVFPESWESSSSYGPHTIDVAAPGAAVSILDLTGARKRLSGTSFSTAHVSAIAAQVWGREPNLTAAQVKARILSSARGLAPSGGINRNAKYVRTGYVTISQFR